VIRRVISATQEVDYLSGDTFPAETHERALDRLTMLAQQNEASIARALVFPTSESTSGVLPTVTERALKILSFDALGKPVVVVPTTDSAAELRIDLASGDGGEQVGKTYTEAPTYLKTLSDIAQGYPVSVHRWMTQAEIDDALTDTAALDHTAAFQDAFLNYSRLTLDRGKYNITGAVQMDFDRARVDFGDSQIVCAIAGGGVAFKFGTTADTPTRESLKVRGGYFSLLNPASTDNTTYLRIAATMDFSVDSVRMKNVGNGGLLVEAGCENGDISRIRVLSPSGHATCRGIWLAGSTASDFQTQLLDTTSLTRNAIAAPVYAVKNVNVHHCIVKLDAYGVYLMNTRDCSVEDNYIDISGAGAQRCIALNNYSPGARVSRNTLVSDRSSTGILITQFSTGVGVEGNRIKGTFGGNRDIYLQAGAEASIRNNIFETETTQNIQIDTAGTAEIKNNRFTRAARVADHRVVYMTPIDSGVFGTTQGDTATVIPGVTFRENYIKNRCIGVFADTSNASLAGTLPAFDMLDVADNTFVGMDAAATASEYGLRVVAGISANVTRLRYKGNTMLPNSAAIRNVMSTTGSAVYKEAEHISSALFSVAVATGGGAITVTRLAGDNFSLSVSRTGTELLLTPRTVNGASGASVAPPIAFVDSLGTGYHFDCRASGSQFIVRPVDSAGAAINTATTATTFQVLVVSGGGD
jgi:hypothetical protein